VELGEGVTVALTSSGAVYTWGSDKYALGHGAGVSEARAPRQVEALSDVAVVDVSVGRNHCAAVSAEGELFTWGFGGNALAMKQGALGHGDKTHQRGPALVEWFEKEKVRVVRVSCGKEHTAVLSTDGRVFCFGEGEFGRLGTSANAQPLPAPVDFPDASLRFVQVSCGSSFTVALDTQGRVWGWGKNGRGQLGQGENAALDVHASDSVPQMVAQLADAGEVVVDVAAGREGCVALCQSGNVFMWGDGRHLSPFHVTDLPFERQAKLPEIATRVSAGYGVYGVLSNYGHVYTWGKNMFSGVAGHPESVGSVHPRLVRRLEHVPIRSLHLGYRAGAAISGTPPTKPLQLGFPTLPNTTRAD
jgi:alpha-tubulin suppressor-like RCC1 family protein